MAKKPRKAASPPKPPPTPPTIDYKASVAKDLEKLTPEDAKRVVTKLEKTLRGEGHKGEALAGKFTGLFKLRVGDYRVIYSKMERGFLVLRIGHRREVYRT